VADLPAAVGTEAAVIVMVVAVLAGVLTVVGRIVDGEWWWEGDGGR